MAQKEIEVILTRQLASYLATPTLIVDPLGTLLFYNEPAEEILGLRFEEADEMPLDQWTAMIAPSDAQGVPLAADVRPLMIAVNERRPVHDEMWIQGLDQVRRHIEVTAFPLIGQAGRYLGAVAIFWEVKE